MISTIMLSIKPFHSTRGCLSYLVSDTETKDAVIIDPSEEVSLKDYLDALSESALTLRYILETHTHADHVSSASSIKERAGGLIGRHYLAPSKKSDVLLREGDEIKVGTHILRVLETPGHTNESVSFLAGNAVFTGDVLLIGATGRTDFQLGDSVAEYESLHDMILALPPETVVWPAHDYKGRTHTTIDEERKTNPRLQWSKEEFVSTMDGYHPPKPDLFDEAITKNSL